MATLQRRYSKKNALAVAGLAKLSYYKQSKTRIQSRLHDEYGLDLVAFLDDRKTDTQGLVAAGPRAIAVVFRGTESPRDMVTDARARKARMSLGTADCRVHRGFSRAYRSVRAEVAATVKELAAAGKRPIFITGHSLGAALATLCAVDLVTRVGLDTPQVYTFGSPRVGDEHFAEIYNRRVPTTYRIRNNRDIVTTIPRHGFKHVGIKKNYSGKGRLRAKPPDGVSFSDHKLANYLKMLAK